MLIEDHDILSEFVTESQERVDRIEEFSLGFPAPGNAPDADAINKTYRELHTLKGNASFVGLANMVDLCHASEAVLKDLLEGNRVWGEDVEGFFLAAVDRLRGFLADPAHSIDQDVSDLLNYFNTEVEVPLTDIAVTATQLLEMAQEVVAANVEPEVDVDFNPQPAELAAPDVSDMAKLVAKHEGQHEPREKPALPTGIETKDSDCYRVCLIKSQRVSNDSPDQWLAYRMKSVALSLAQSSQLGTFTANIMEELHGQEEFRFVDRVCLAAVIPDTNRLQVVDVANSRRAGPNAMTEGYSCYTNPNGSLFQLKPGMLRVFDKASSVIESFRREGKPVQRSIAKIGSMGLKSGLCLAVGVNDKPEGFLFMNSCNEGVFRNVDKDFPLVLGYLTSLARLELLRHGFGLSSEAEREPCTPFSADNFQSYMNFTAEELGVQFDTIKLVERNGCNFLYEPTRLAQILCRILWVLQSCDREQTRNPEIHFGLCGNKIAFKLMHLTNMKSVNQITPLLKQLGLLHGYEITSGKHLISVRFAYEPGATIFKHDHYSVL